MKKLLLSSVAVSVITSMSAFAQTTMTPSTPPADTTAPSTPPAITTMPATPPARTTMPSPGTAGATLSTQGMTLTDEQAKSWIDKAVYSSDGAHLGEVAMLTRDASGKLSELHADIGGFLGIGETRVRVMPTQFQLANDRVILALTGEQAKALPKIQK